MDARECSGGSDAVEQAFVLKRGADDDPGDTE
jgi:hypothetical protein